MDQKVLVIGLDCIPPELIFDTYKEHLPNIRNLMDNGIYGQIRSSSPPASANAWTAMTTGRGTDSNLGIYDYIYRRNRSYNDIGVINSNLVKGDRIWDILSKNGKKVMVINVPLTYPAKKVNGFMITGPLTPEKAEYTYPSKLQEELEKNIGERAVLISNPRQIKREELLEKIYEVTKLQFKVIRHLIKKKKWDFSIGVIYSTDALMHNFWSYIDSKHKKHEPNSNLKHAIRDFLKYADDELGKIISMVDKDTTLIVMSDHGAKRMDGRININDWLIQNGYLVLKKKPKKPTQIYEADVDWEKTRVFSMGAYYSCLYFNVKGRDPSGIVKTGKEYEELKKEIKEKIKKIPDDSGNKLDTKVFELPESDNAPDILVYFDNLHWGVNSTVSHNSLYSWATEKGPDDAVHSETGFFIIFGKNVKKRGNLGLKDIRDITPTILKTMGIKIPKDIEGKPINF